jgi:hypothetical protein
MGQLSVWRDIEKIPLERAWEANLVFSWDIAGEHPVDAVWQALGALASRHESLRTTYLVDENGDPRQCIGPDDPAAVLEDVRQGVADIGERAALEAEQLRRAFDVAREMPWRAWILTAGGVPRQILIVMHHIAADAAGLLIMRDDFPHLLAGTPLPAATTVRELAMRQRDGGARAIRAAEGYWRRTLSTAPRQLTPDAPGPAVGATLHTGIPVSMAHKGAANLGISVSSVLLAAYYRALRDTTGTARILLYPMSSNRFDPAVATLVTSQNQWVPLVAEFDGTEPFEVLATKLHWKTFNALKHGCYDPDVIARLRVEANQEVPAVDPGYHFNAVIAPAGDPAAETVEPARTEWYEPARATGPGFYLIARGISSIELVFRVNRAGFDQETLSRCLTSIQDTLVSITAGGGR